MTDHEFDLFLSRTSAYHQQVAKNFAGLQPYPVTRFGLAFQCALLIALASQLAAIATGDPQSMEPVRALHVEFADCLPIIK